MADIKSLSCAFSDTLNEDALSCVSEYAEMGLDAILEDGVLKEIPIVSTAVAVFKVSSSIKERDNIKKLIVFLDEMNKRIVDEEKRSKYRHHFKNDEKFRNKEIERLLILIDRYIGDEKPRLLAKLYLSYLDKIIVWEEFVMYSEVIDRFLFLDCERLVSEGEAYITYRNLGAEPLLRLVSLGLMVEDTTGNSLFVNNGNGGFSVTSSSMERAVRKERKYVRTEFGEKLANILR